MQNDPECDLNANYLIEQQLTFFCGSALECHQLGNVQALNQAKYNAEMNYAVIGVTEHYQTSFALFEKFLPRSVC